MIADLITAAKEMVFKNDFQMAAALLGFASGVGSFAMNRAYKRFLGGTDPSKRARSGPDIITSSHGSLLLSALKAGFGKHIDNTQLEQVIIDMRIEWLEAKRDNKKWSARLAIVRGYVLFWKYFLEWTFGASAGKLLRIVVDSFRSG